MFTAESIKLLAGRRQPRSMSTKAVLDVASDDTITSGAHRDTDGADEPDSIPVTVGDPNDDIDPDDRSRADAVPSIPEMPPAAWWIRMTLDPPDSRVSSEDVRLVFWHIRRRLARQEATTGALQPPTDVRLARLPASECQGGQGRSSDAARDAGDPGDCAQMVEADAPRMENENLAFPETVGQLHEAIENLGPGAWLTFVSLWQEAAGIQQPKRQPKTDCALTPAVAPEGQADTSLPPLPSSAYPMEEGLHRALNEMPPQVAAFLLHVPKDPPVWRYQESEGERVERQALENLGAWTG
jgi:hypothetical protein